MVKKKLEDTSKLEEDLRSTQVKTFSTDHEVYNWVKEMI